jgi:hypothetical protein
MKISRFSLAVLLVSALIFPVSALAQTSAPETGKVVVIATVNIQNTQIVSQSGRVMTIAFDLTNREGIQPAVKYGVSLIQSSAAGKLVADEKVFDEVLTLGEGANIHKEITYTVPEQISGTYDLFVSSRNSNGMPLGSMLVGMVTFYPSAEGSVSIDPSSCFLSVKGDAKNTRYTLLQGVDIASTETLEAHCAVSNTTKETVTLTPSFVTNYRNAYGAVVAATGGDTASVTLASNERKDVVIALPKAATPQAYDVTLALSAEGKVVSNTVKFHYVLRGASATIQNVVWDKGNYQQGDTAVISFSWAPSADTFSGARAAGTPITGATVELSMVDENGVSCGAPVSAVLNSDTALVSLNIVTTSGCIHPEIRATVKDATHGVLSTGNFQTVTPVVAAAPMSGSGGSSGTTVLLFVLAVLILGVIIFFVMKQKGKGTTGTPPAAGMMLLALMLAGGMFGAAPQARADTWNADGDAVYTGNINKGWNGSYAAGESIHVTGSVEKWSCGNEPYVEFKANVDGVTVNGQSGTFGPGIYADTVLYSGSNTGGIAICEYINAPNTGGTHHLSFGGYSSGNSTYAFYDIPFIVTIPPPPPPAPVVTLTQSPSATVVSGTNGFISWSATNNPTSCSVARDGTTIATNQPASVTNYPLGMLTSNTTLTVTCVNAGGSDSKSVTFTVTAIPPRALRSSSES